MAADDSVKQVGIGPRLEWFDIRVKQAVDEDMAVCAEHGARERGKPGGSDSDRQIRVTAFRCDAVPGAFDPLAGRFSSYRQDGRDDGCPEIRVPKSVEVMFVSCPVPQHLQVEHNLREAEDYDAEMPWHRCFDCHAWSHMEWRNWHLAPISPAAPVDKRIFKRCANHAICLGGFS